MPPEFRRGCRRGGADTTRSVDSPVSTGQPRGHTSNLFWDVLRLDLYFEDWPSKFPLDWTIESRENTQVRNRTMEPGRFGRLDVTLQNRRQQNQTDRPWLRLVR